MANKSKTRAQTLTDLSVAIYPGFALVQGVYKVHLKKGDNKFQLQGLPVHVDADSVYVDSFTGPGNVTLGGTSYRAANLNPLSLQAKALNNKVTLYFGSAVPAEQQQLKGTLLNLVGNLPGGTAVVQIEDDVRVVPNVQSVSFDSLPEGLSNTPSLSVNASAEKEGWYLVRLLYKTRGMSWSADYKWVYDEKSGTIDLEASVKVTNNSGAAYDKAKLKVVAGDVGNGMESASDYESVGLAMAPQMAGGRAAVSKQVKQATTQSLGNVKVYTVPGSNKLEEGERQGLPFLTRAGVPVKREFHAKPFHSWHSYGNRQESKVETVYLLKNDDANKLGVALPGGGVQILQRDEHGDLLPSGSGYAAQLAVNDELKVEAGSDFDLKVTRIVKNLESKDGPPKTTGKKGAKTTTKKVTHTRDCAVELFNGKDRDVEFKLEEVLGEGLTFKGKNNLVQVAAGLYEQRVTVAAGQTATVEFTLVEVEEVEVETESQE